MIDAGVTRWGRIFALLAAVILATSYIATAIAMRSFSPMSAAMWRGVLSSLLLTPLVLIHIRGRRRHCFDRPATVRLLILGFCGGLGVVVGMNFAIAYAGATIASFCIALASVLAAVMAPALLREPLKPNALLGFGAALVGTAALTGLIGVAGSVSILGIVAGLFGALCFALFLVLSRRWVGQYGLSDTAVSLAIAMTTGIGLLAVELMLEGQAIWPAEIRPDALLGLAWLAVMPGVGAQLLLVASARRLEISSSAALLLVKPVATAVFAVLLLGEVLQPVQLVGATLVLAGIALAEKRPLRARSIAAVPSEALSPGPEWRRP